MQSISGTAKSFLVLFLCMSLCLAFTSNQSIDIIYWLRLSDLGLALGGIVTYVMKKRHQIVLTSENSNPYRWLKITFFLGSAGWVIGGIFGTTIGRVSGLLLMALAYAAGLEYSMVWGRTHRFKEVE